jgi:hypothetical protein
MTQLDIIEVAGSFELLRRKFNGIDRLVRKTDVSGNFAFPFHVGDKFP